MSTLRVYSIARQLVRAVHALLPRIAERSRDLADQIDRSSRSVAANIAEGEHRHDGNGRQRFKTAYGSARETRAHLEMAVDVGMEEAVATITHYTRTWQSTCRDADPEGINADRGEEVLMGKYRWGAKRNQPVVPIWMPEQIIRGDQG